MLRTILLSFCFLNPSLAVSGSVTGTISSHEVNLEVTCKTQGNNLMARSTDPGWKDEDTNGDGYFFKASAIGGGAAFVFIKGEETFTFGDLGSGNLTASAGGLNYQDTIRSNRDASTYDVDFEIVC